MDQIDSSYLADGVVVIRGRSRKGKDGQVNFYGEYIWPEGLGYHPEENLIERPLKESVVLDMNGLLKKENLSSLQDLLKTLKPGNVEIYIDFGDKKFRLKDKYDKSCKEILSSWKEKLEKK